MADTTIWATIVSVLATFTLEKVKDDTGRDTELEIKYTDGVSRYLTSNSNLKIDILLTGWCLSSHPLPFQCSIRPRSAEARQLILNTVTTRD